MVYLSKQQLSSVGPMADVENFCHILVPDIRQGPRLTWKRPTSTSKWVGEPDYSYYVFFYAILCYPALLYDIPCYPMLDLSIYLNNSGGW